MSRTKDKARDSLKDWRRSSGYAAYAKHLHIKRLRQSAKLALRQGAEALKRLPIRDPYLYERRLEPYSRSSYWRQEMDASTLTYRQFYLRIKHRKYSKGWAAL